MRWLGFFLIFLLGFMIVTPFIPNVKANPDPPTITYDDVNEIITVANGTTNNLFYDIWVQADANGWQTGAGFPAVLSNHTYGWAEQKQFTFNVVIYLDNATVTDVDKQIDFTYEVCRDTLIEYDSLSYIRFGNVSDASEKLGKNGVCFSCGKDSSFYFIEGQIGFPDTSGCMLYGCSFTTPDTTASGTLYFLSYEGDKARLWSCTLFNSLLQHVHIDIANCQFISMPSGSNHGSTNIESITTRNWIVHGFTYGIYPITSTLTSMHLSGNTYDFKIYKSTGTVKCLDFIADWTFIFDSRTKMVVYRQYTFDLNVTNSNGTPIQNANVTLTNNQGQVGSWLTYANGTIQEQTVSMGYYDRAGGNTIHSYNPYNLTITKADVGNYTQIFTLSEKTDWTITLTEETGGEGGYLYFAPAFLLAFLIGLAIMIVWIKK